WQCNNVTAGALVDGEPVKLDWRELGVYGPMDWEDNDVIVRHYLPPQPQVGRHRLVMKVTNDIGIGIVDNPYRKKEAAAAPFHSEVLDVGGNFEVLDRPPPIRHENKNIDAAAMAKAI